MRTTVVTLAVFAVQVTSAYQDRGRGKIALSDAQHGDERKNKASADAAAARAEKAAKAALDKLPERKFDPW